MFEEKNENDENEKQAENGTSEVSNEEKYLDLYLRSQAEIANMQVRNEKAIQSSHKFAIQKFIEALLPSLDSLQLAINSSGDNEGLKMTQNSFIQTFEKFNVTIIQPEKGEAFNANTHEVLNTTKDPILPDNSIVEILQVGYMIYDRLIRPARVVIVNNQNGEDSQNEQK